MKARLNDLAGWLARWGRRARYLVGRRRAERDMDEEFRVHVEMQAQENLRRGMTPEEARRCALLAFGGVERYKEAAREARGARWLEDFAADFRYAARKLRRSPGYTTVAVLTLALGIGATTAIFSVVNGVVFKPLPFGEPSQLVRLRTAIEGEDRVRVNLSPPNFMSLRDDARAFTDIVAFQTNDVTWTGGGQPRRLEGARVSAGFFELFGVEPVLGRTFRSEENESGNHRVVVLGHGLWQQAFGADPDLVGQTITLDGVAYTVVGVMPPGFSYPPDRALWTPRVFTRSWSATTTVGRKSNTVVPVLARLRPGITLSAARADLAAMGRRLAARFPETNTGVSFTAERLRDDIVGEARTPLLLLFGSVGLVLFIACANVISLLLARAASRQEELAARAALGAGRGRLVRQLLAESMLLGVVGGLLGLAVAFLGTEALLAAQPEGLPRLDDVRVDAMVLAFASGLTLLASTVVGLAPALQATRGALSSGLRVGGRNRLASRGGTRLRAGLVVSEIALAVVLLAAAGLLMRSFIALTTVDPGLRVERVLAFPLDLDVNQGYDTGEKVRLFYDELLDRIRGLPSVEAAAAVSRLPIARGPFMSRFGLEGQPPPRPGELEPSIFFLSVTADYFRTMGIPIVRGRGLTDEDLAGSLAVIVINQAAADRFFPGDDPIGKRLVRFSFDPIEDASDAFTVAGVIGNVHAHRPSIAPQPTAYFAHAQVPIDNMSVVVATAGPPLALTRAIRAEVRALDSSLAIPRFTTIEQALADSVARPRFTATLLGIFAAIALALASIGIFGLLSFAVAQQTREIGIRIAMGARPSEVLRRVVRRALGLAGIGLTIGLLAALALTRLLESVLFGVSPTDPATYGAVAVLLGGTVLLAGLLPARRAATVDPMVALRQE